MSSWPTNRRITAPDLVLAKSRHERWAMLTSYDALTAPIFEEVGAKALLIGDSAANTVYGYHSTVPVTLDELLPLAAAVVRSTSTALIIGDLPFGTYQSGARQAMESATRMMKEAGVGAIKLEGGSTMAPQVEALVTAGIPVMGHLGLTPQSVHVLGGYKVQGRGEAGERVLMDAKALESAGAFAVVLEAVPAELAARVTAELSIPTVGIGAGAQTDAQVMVWQDMVGLTPSTPKFVKRYAEVGQIIESAARQFVAEVESGEFPDEEHTYH